MVSRMTTEITESIWPILWKSLLALALPLLWFHSLHSHGQALGHTLDQRRQQLPCSALRNSITHFHLSLQQHFTFHIDFTLQIEDILTVLGFINNWQAHTFYCTLTYRWVLWFGCNTSNIVEIMPSPKIPLNIYFTPEGARASPRGERTWKVKRMVHGWAMGVHHNTSALPDPCCNMPVMDGPYP